MTLCLNEHRTIRADNHVSNTAHDPRSVSPGNHVIQKMTIGHLIKSHSSQRSTTGRRNVMFWLRTPSCVSYFLSRLPRRLIFTSESNACLKLWASFTNEIWSSGSQLLCSGKPTDSRLIGSIQVRPYRLLQLDSSPSITSLVTTAKDLLSVTSRIHTKRCPIGLSTLIVF